MKSEPYIDQHVELVARCKLGERKAQYELYQRYSKAMFNVCMRILNHFGEAEDALQEAFMDAFTNLHQFRQQSTFGAWLKQIVVNRALSQIRSRKVEWVELSSWEQNGGQTLADYQEDSDELDLDVQRIQTEILMLPDGYRVVLSLYLFEGYDHEEISEVLGISESTSRSQYLRGKRKLLERIGSRNGL
ncbi:RNA polymerase sigma-70 factor (ECF subfamily) [Dyadobacter jejuensis]|uniref:RNA polymerase sigma-70 factor (ECF subfamily) n=1 Tax=Dyadobacter jejuensis TaxID=1082580 RepID=A0A316BBU2_9BACT|nr:RNA polymerase sigma factor [Dyadobacter jejuensis]PWJ59947.1 RNA polymerase sigma-70 factor (ECF subfamily) [Dyadobacter jejuensis]